jgi:hypothetical protein
VYVYGVRFCTVLHRINSICRQLLRVRVYTDTRFLGRMMMNVTEFLFVRTEPDTQILRVSAVYRTMETKECFEFWKQKNIFECCEQKKISNYGSEKRL